MKPRTESDHRRPARRSGQRRLSAAEGVLVALRRYSLDEAFAEIVQMAQRHSVAPLQLADALVTIAENDSSRDLDDALIAAVDQSWGALLLASRPSNLGDCDRAQQPPVPITHPKAGDRN